MTHKEHVGYIWVEDNYFNFNELKEKKNAVKR